MPVTPLPRTLSRMMGYTRVQCLLLYRLIPV